MKKMYDNYYSSNARKLNYSELTHYSTDRKTTLENNTKIKKAEVKKQSAFAFMAKCFFVVSAVFAIAFFLVNGEVAIHESENSIKRLKNELRMIEADNQAIRAQIDKSIDLKNLQTVAGEKFGMVRPENYQVFYMNMDFEDYTEKVGGKKDNKEKKEIPVESVTGVLISSADMFR